jgi:hypothetical protein
MREIKFRGERIDGKGQVEGYYFETPLSDEATGAKVEDGLFFLTGRPRHIISQNNCAYEVDPKTIRQYIGLKDWNGKEVYIGDILQDERGKRYIIVEYMNGWCMRRNGRTNSLNFVQTRKVIGNIYDKSE